MIDSRALRKFAIPEVTHQYTAKDCILYSLGVGLGTDPLDARELNFLVENELRVLPTFAAVMGHPGLWHRNPATGLDWRRIVHVGFDLRLQGPLAPAGRVIGRSRVARIVDKGRTKGALLTTERKVVDESTGRLVAVMESTMLCRSDGGFEGGDADLPPPAAPKTSGPPHEVFELRTSPRAALIYRLSGDLNPLHADPGAAKVAGFERPILHGLCSFGIAGLAVLARFCEWDPSRVKGIAVRFAAPVYPGETLRTELWKYGSTVRFRSTAVERGVETLSNGLAEIN